MCVCPMVNNHSYGEAVLSRGGGPAGQQHALLQHAAVFSGAVPKLECPNGGLPEIEN